MLVSRPLRHYQLNIIVTFFNIICILFIVKRKYYVTLPPDPSDPTSYNYDAYCAVNFVKSTYVIPAWYVVSVLLMHNIIIHFTRRIYSNIFNIKVCWIIIKFKFQRQYYYTGYFLKYFWYFNFETFNDLQKKLRF